MKQFRTPDPGNAFLRRIDFCGPRCADAGGSESRRMENSKLPSGLGCGRISFWKNKRENILISPSRYLEVLCLLTENRMEYY